MPSISPFVFTSGVFPPYPQPPPSYARIRPKYRDTASDQIWKRDDLPAFFSWRVSSFQSTFMRSRRAIQRSACSCGGMASHRFSMLASVGLEIACAFRTCCDRARGVSDAAVARVDANEPGSWRRRGVVRSIVIAAGREEWSGRKCQ